jgi:hypothetical protein
LNFAEAGAGALTTITGLLTVVGMGEGALLRSAIVLVADWVTVRCGD